MYLSQRDVALKKVTDANALFFNVDLMGYQKSNVAAGKNGFYEVSGWNDAMYNVMSTLDALNDASWPWETP